MKRHERPALVAQHVVMVIAGGIDELVPSNPVTHIEPVDQIVLLQQLEYPVHARTPDAAPPPARRRSASSISNAVSAQSWRASSSISSSRAAPL